MTGQMPSWDTIATDATFRSYGASTARRSQQSSQCSDMWTTEPRRLTIMSRVRDATASYIKLDENWKRKGETRLFSFSCNTYCNSPYKTDHISSSDASCMPPVFGYPVWSCISSMLVKLPVKVDLDSAALSNRRTGRCRAWPETRNRPELGCRQLGGGGDGGSGGQSTNALFAQQS